MSNPKSNWKRNVSRTDLVKLLPGDYRTRVLGDMQDQMVAQMIHGTACLCCGQHVQVYSNPFGADMAYSLIWLVQEYARVKDWINVSKQAPRKVAATRKWDKLRHWGLVEAKLNLDTKLRTSGLWIPTANGVAFVNNRSKVLSHCVTYNGHVIRFDGTPVSIVEVLASATRQKFDYGALMQGIA